MLKKIWGQLNSEYDHFKFDRTKPENYEKLLKKIYKEKTGQDLKITNPTTYTEKMQYSKLYNNPLIKSKLTDKYLVREFVADKVGEEYLIPLIGAWDSFSEINFDKFPNQFILKTNHGVNTNIIVKNKDNFDYSKAKSSFNRWMKKNYAHNLALHYKNIEPKIIAEELIGDNLVEYDFYCFSGKVYYCLLTIEIDGVKYRNIYNTDWELEEWRIGNKFENTPKEINKPMNFDKMVEIAETLSEGISHVRVDLYNVDGQIYFGEMTFTSGSGFSLIYPEEYNYKLGQLWDVENL